MFYISVHESPVENGIYDFNPAKEKLSPLMKKPYHFFIFILIGVFLAMNVSVSFGQTKKIQKALDGLHEFSQIYVSVPVDAFVSELSEVASIDYFERNRVYLYINSNALDFIISEGIDFRLEKSPGVVDFDLNMVDAEALLNKDLTESWDFYPTYEAYVALMNKFEADYPDLVQIHNIGTTVLGRSLLFAQIGPNVETSRPVPQFMYTSTMHGDETAGFVISLRLIHHLLSSYGVDDDITDLMNGVEIWICPNENPDGTYTNNNSTVNGATRFNDNGKDLNRNYPTVLPGSPNPPETPIQPETQAMIDFVSTKNFSMSANMHGGIELVNYPFDSWKSSQQLHADNDWWEFTMNEFVDTIHAYSPSGYMTGQGGGVTHGGDWYVVYGGRQDYMNWFHGCREFTFEISNAKLLDPALLPAHWEYNYRSLINYIRHATYGFHGLVKSAETEEPVFASIELTGHDIYNSEVSTSMPFGNFARPVYAGNYDLTVIADGYPTVTMENLEIDNYERIDLEIFLGENTTPVYVYSSDYNTGSADGSGIYPQGYELTISATPFHGYEFLYWENADGEIVSESQEFTFTVSDYEKVYYAVFTGIPTEFAVHFTAGEGQGTVNAFVNGNPIETGFFADLGSDVLFEAVPSMGYKVDSWKLNGNIIPGFIDDEYLVSDVSETIRMETNFILASYDLSVNIVDEAGGSIEISPESETFHYGETITLTAVPDEGYVFHSWSNEMGVVLSTYDSYSFSMPANNLVLQAKFELLSLVEDYGNHADIKIFPNPAKNQLTVESAFVINSYELYDESGRLMMKGMNLSDHNAVINLEMASSGFYFIRVVGERTSVTSKFQIF
jgi:hypothetical protein